MSHFKKNVITTGLSGKFDDQLVFRQVDGKTIFAGKPRPAKPSTAQTGVRSKFLAAATYAKAALANPTVKEEYQEIAKQKQMKSSYVAALTDYLTSTELVMVYAQPFDGTAGFPVTIALADNYKGKEMFVAISNKDGTVIESGNASLTFGESAWKYITTASYPDITDLRISVSVKDRIGNIANFEKLLKS